MLLVHLGLASDKHHCNVKKIPVSGSGALLRNTSIVLGSLADKLAGEKFHPFPPKVAKRGHFVNFTLSNAR